MSKRKVLIIDDEDRQVKNLVSICDEIGLEYERLAHWEDGLDYIRQHHFDLLILDLGYWDDEKKKVCYSGGNLIDQLNKTNIYLPIMVYSTLYQNPSVDPEGVMRMTELSNSYKNGQIRIVSQRDQRGTIIDAIKMLIGSSRLGAENDFVILHFSDLQIGGNGLIDSLPNRTEGLATSVFEAINNFIASDANDEIKMRSPDLCVASGDITEHGRPEEYIVYNEYSALLNELIAFGSPSMKGLLDYADPNIINVPGNHDLNWDLMRSRCLHPGEDGIELNLDEANTKLDFVHRFAWLPYSLYLKDHLNKSSFDWAWDPGFKIIPLEEEIGIRFICMNSARWSCTCIPDDHLALKEDSRGVIVTENVINEMRSELNKMTNPCAINVLVLHHTLDQNAPLDHRLFIEGKSYTATLDHLKSKLGVSMILAGHIHETSVQTLHTPEENRVVLVGAGTMSRDDTPKYVGPQFHLIRLFRGEDSLKNFTHCTAVTFHYDGTGGRFSTLNAYAGGTQCWKTMALS